MQLTGFTRGTFRGGATFTRRRRLWVTAIAVTALLCGARASAQVPASSLSAIDAAFNRGDLEAASTQLAALDPVQPAVSVRLGRLEAWRGQYDDALRHYRSAATGDPGGEGALALATLLRDLGRPDEAAAVLTALDEALDGQLDGASLMRRAGAAHLRGQFEEANEYFREAAAASPGDPAIDLAWGSLFLEKHNLPDAVTSLQQAVANAPDLAAAHLALAEAQADENPPAATASATRALAINGSLVEAHVLLGELALDDRRYAEARAHVGRGLAINPRHLDGLAVEAAIAYLENRRADHDAAVAKALAVNPRFGEIHRVVGARVAQHYRFEEAAAITRLGVELDPGNARARADLGMQLMRTGDEAGAQRELDTAFGLDPYDTVTYNLLALLDTLQKFTTIERGGMIYRFHADEATLMPSLAEPLAAAAMASFSERYRFTPKGPILIEMFPRHDDFAVRTAGLPGMIGALGACFGRVVTLDSPRARPPGSFNWAATLWHELAHVITLQMSNQRVPRWLTEGISVYEERRARASWGRESEVEFASALARGETIPLAVINDAFTNPRLITLAYFQASLVVEHIVELQGEEAIHRMLRAYGEGLDDRGVLARELKVDVAALQATFDGFVQRRYGRAQKALTLPESVGELPREAEALATLAEAHQGTYPIQIAAGRAALAGGDLATARRTLERAVALVPFAGGEAGPRGLLAQVLEKQGDRAGAVTLLSDALEHDTAGLETARRLATLARETGDRQQLEKAQRRIVEVQPFDGTEHSALARLFLDTGNASGAVLHFGLAMAAGPADPAGARTDLAEALLAAGDRAAAKREILTALEATPRYERAQDLLLAIVDSAPRGGRP